MWYLMLKYLSGSSQEEIVLSDKKIRAKIRTSGLYDSEWEVEDTKQAQGRKVEEFRRDAATYKVIIDFLGDKRERAENANRFADLCEEDIFRKFPGTLFLNGYKIKCFVIGSEIGAKDSRTRMERIEAKIYAPYPVWVMEEKKSFYPDSAERRDDYAFLEYPYDYSYDYSRPKSGTENWYIDHYRDSNFEMTIYGPCVDPKIIVNGYPYQVNDTLEAGEYIVIRSREKKVMKYLSNGTIQSIFEKREKKNSVFKRIPSGELILNWDGTFGFDLTIYKERGAPKWI